MRDKQGDNQRTMGIVYRITECHSNTRKGKCDKFLLMN